MGTRAFSHDSIFIPDGGAESEQTTQAMSQDNILGKVKTLQRQLGKNIKFGQPPPHAAPMKKADGGDTSLEEDLFLTSPIEIVTHQDVILCDSENQPSDPSSSLSPLNQPATRSEMEEKVTPVKPSRPKRHFSSAGTIESVNLDAIPRAIARLDNSAARHKLAVKPKNQRVSKRQRRLTGDPLGEQSSLLPPLSLDQNGHSGEDKLAWHEEEPEPQDPEEKRCHEEYWRELEAKCKRQKAEAAEKRRLEEQRQQALERRLWEENRQPELPEPRDEEQKLRGEGPAAPGQEWMEPEKDRAAEGDKHLQDRLQLQQVLEERGRQEAEKQRQEEEEREQELWRKREEERRQEELEEQRRQEEEERRKELLRKEEERMKREEERMKELRRQEEERIKQEERMKELRRQEEERIKQEEERMKELRRQEEERIKQEERMKELRRQEEERIKQEEERLKQEERMKELRRQEEERMKQEEERMKELRRQEERMKQEEERMKQEEERMKALRKQEEERMKQEEERMKQEERMKALRRQEEERKRKEALRKEAETEAQRRQEAEKKVGEEERPLDLAHQRGLRSPRRRKDLAEKADSAPQPEQPGAGQEARSGEKRQPQPPEGPQGERRQGKSEGTRAQRPQKPEAAKEEPPALADRSGEELRWREVDERQSTPRPYTFQVSSGGKQILFPKVNLSPVTPLKEAGLASVPQEPKAPKASPAPHSLPSALSVPHTAILVTGAQLCGPAVNLSQIKDTACRSLLGLSEEKKHVEAPAPEQQPPRASGDPRAGSGRARPPQEPPSSEGALAEWVSIRSRILKNAEGEPRGDKEPPGPEGDGEEARASDLRKAPSISAKFCIKPAWQKFADSDGESSRKRTAPAAGEGAARPPPAAADAQEPTKGLEKAGVQREPADTTEGCKFAKDLPSFLVPGLPSPPLQPPSPQKAAAPGEPVSAPDSEARGSRKPDPAVAGGEEKASPFGIKLRRTNYSLRFHSDQQAEQKKKKRHSSTGESGGAAGGERETAPQPGPALAPPDRPPAPASAESAPDHSAPAAQPAPPPANTHSPTPEHKATHKMPMVQKPALAPKPTSQTPPSSPLSKLSRPYLAELLSRRPGKPEAEPGELSKEPGARPPQPPSPPPQPPHEDLGPERKSSSPAHPASRGEKPSQSPEPERREKPVLQSRHSLDGSRLAEKGEPAQPLWVTLALQKQKGFREQQATREERKQAREARQAEKFSKDNASISRAGSLHKPVTQPEAQKPEELKPDTAVTRLERREHLKKANTLPTSVTVEISDSAPPVPLVKEVTKRLSTPDAAPMSTEPAWLALAKRKAKAWSDCPQIIK